MAKYGILRVTSVGLPYWWAFNTYEEAWNAAKDLCEKAHIQVILFNCIGKFSPEAKYTPEE